ncbi:MAG: peptidylprolyl isomerase [Candidatus Latescibacterota bacterium]|jgi:peptidyl-prolyl cis-trans isomerase A (cyclophilin A)
MRAAVLLVGLAAWLAGCKEETAGFNRETLMNPAGEAFKQTAPERFRVRFETSVGDFTVEVERALAPTGADRFYNLVRNGFYHDQRFFRVVPGFVVQWGIHGDPAISARWEGTGIADEPVRGSNQRGILCFAAASAPNSRTTQVFISLKDNAYLDGYGFAPFGRVTEGIETVDKLNGEYGEAPSKKQNLIQQQGNRYLQEQFPALDYIKATKLLD